MKIWVLNKKSGILILTLIVMVAAALLVGKNSSVAVSGKQRELPIYCVDKGDEKVLSISFDAAWGNGK